MREFSDIFDQGLLKGLRRFKTNPRNNQALTELHNLEPSDEGLEPHEPIVSLNSSANWGGLGQGSGGATTRDITLSIKDYVSDADIEGVSVWVDDVLVGTTDADGEISLTLAVGGHTFKATKTGYEDTDDDDLLNDYFVVS